jgi:hypothetical protein
MLPPFQKEIDAMCHSCECPYPFIDEINDASHMTMDRKFDGTESLTFYTIECAVRARSTRRLLENRGILNESRFPKCLSWPPQHQPFINRGLTMSGWGNGINRVRTCHASSG